MPSSQDLNKASATDREGNRVEIGLGIKGEPDLAKKIKEA
jgi:hypothetical protein